VAWLSATDYSQLGLAPGDFLRVTQEGGEATVAVAVDERLPAGCVRLAAARPETARLGSMMGTVTAARVAGQQKVAV
jgi:NADH-quinone oxidoreductase subunit G